MSKLRVVVVLSGLAAAALASGVAIGAETVKARPHHVYLIGSLRINQAWIDVSGAAGGDAPAYLTVENRGEGPDRLVGASVTGAASAVIVPASGAGASDGSGVPVPAGSTVTLKPGDAHLVVRGLSGVTAASTPLEATLRFERAGSLHLSFTTDRAAALRDDDSAPSEEKPVHLSQ